MADVRSQDHNIQTDDANVQSKPVSRECNCIVASPAAGQERGIDLAKPLKSATPLGLPQAEKTE